MQNIAFLEIHCNWRIEIRECKYSKNFKDVTFLFNGNGNGISKNINKV